MKYIVEKGKWMSPNIIRVTKENGKTVKKVIACMTLTKKEGDELADRIVEFLNKDADDSDN